MIEIVFKNLMFINKPTKFFIHIYNTYSKLTSDFSNGLLELIEYAETNSSSINRLSTIARKNQLFDEILDVDQKLKDAATSATAPGSKGFFFANPLDARKALPNTEIVKIDDYVKEYFTDGVLINRLQGQHTSKEIAEAFSNASKVAFTTL